MNRDELAKEYKAFFTESPAGQYFMQCIESLIDAAHKNAEKDPTLARDYTQHARGVRQVKEHIIGIGTEIKKGQKM